MLRAASWAVALFGLGMLMCRIFPVPWIEPLVLLGLGVSMLFVSARSGPRPRRSRALPAKEAAA
ncbi:MAG TPA: hypothetical protein VFG59_04555 [Anaeromyxobacter sp.]|nr:hypothetical protein [Anaeromyxobacter sp.]